MLKAMASEYSPQNGLTAIGAVDHGPVSTQIVRPSFPTSSSSPSSSASRPVRLSKRVLTAIENAQPQSEGTGVEIVLHSNIVTGKELKRALEEMFPGPQEYFVQLRRDRYRITLPKHNKEDMIQRFVSRSTYGT